MFFCSFGLSVFVEICCFVVVVVCLFVVVVCLLWLFVFVVVVDVVCVVAVCFFAVFVFCCWFDCLLGVVGGRGSTDHPCFSVVTSFNRIL